MTRYRNPWHNPRDYHTGPAYFETDAKPVEHAGCLIYHRINSTLPISSGAHVFDVVKPGVFGDVCVSQMAGPRGAREAAERIQRGEVLS